MLKKLITYTAVILAFTACSEDEDETTSSSTTGSISGLPKATGPVVSSSSSSISDFAAVTGLKLSAWGKSSQWTSSKSRAMCETGLSVRDGLSQAMQPDKILCYIGAIQSTGGFGSSTVDDGNYFYFSLANMGSEAPKIKMKIVKTAGAITTFEMLSCFGDGTSQTEYLSQVISSGSATVVSKYIGSESTQTFGSSATVTGELDSSYNWTSKTTELSRYWDGTAGGEGTFGQKLTMTQRSSSLIVDGYSTGTYGSGASANIFTNFFYTVIQGLSMSTPKDIALGDGSSKYNFSWCQDADNSGDCTGESTGANTLYTGSGVDSWNGDTLENLGTATDGDYYDEANAGTLRANDGIPTVTFTADETWDCAAEGTFVDVDMTNMEVEGTALGTAFAACNAEFEFRNDSDANDGYACGATQ